MQDEASPVFYPTVQRWACLAHFNLSLKERFWFGYTINPLSAKLVRSGWLNIGLVRFYMLHLSSYQYWPISRDIDQTRGQVGVVLIIMHA